MSTLDPPVPSARRFRPSFIVCRLGNLVLQRSEVGSGEITKKVAVTCTRQLTIALMVCVASKRGECGSDCSGFADNCKRVFLKSNIHS